MKKLILCCFALNLLIDAEAQNWTWAETAGGFLPDEANGCAIDNNGNMYASGFFFSTSIDFGHGNSISNGGICDGFVVKYDASGNSLWATKVKGTGEDKTTKCAIDNAGNVIATGYFDSPSIQFGGNNANNVSNFDGSGNTFDCFIVKYNAAGSPLWFHTIGKSDDDGGSSVATDSSGNVFVTGWFRAPSIVAGTITLYNENLTGGTSDMFIIKYDPNGNVMWAKSAGSSDDDKGNGCAVDHSGNVIVTGYLKADSINFEGNYYYNHGSKDAFVAKYSSTGTLLAVKVFGGSGGEEPFACSADANGNIFVCGNFSSSTVVLDTVTITNTGSGSGAFLVKLNTALNTLWAKSASSSSNDEARGCSTDIYGNTVITGVFNGPTITFGNTVLNNNGGDEIFLAKYDQNGNLFWAKKEGKSKDDGSNDCSIDNNGKVLIAGYYNSSSLTFGSINLNNSYVGIATSDVFIASTCNTVKGTDSRTACNSYTWIDGNTYTTSNNTATFNIAGGAANTCDSLVTLDLTILNPATGTDTKTACSSYTWIDGNTYTASNNTATFNIAGGAANTCDSLVTLNLTILNPAAGTYTKTTCSSYTWIDGNTYTASNNTATFNIAGGAANTCDSLVTLHLTILSPTAGTDTKTACSSYTWIDGNTYTASNNTATFNIAGGAANTCDSLVTLNLTIDTVDTGITTMNSSLTAIATGATFRWLDCNHNFVFLQGEIAQTFTATANGNYAVEVTQHSCTDTSTCVAISTTGVPENEAFNEVTVYPNPFSASISLSIHRQRLREVTVSIQNTLGQTVYKSIEINLTTSLFKIIDMNKVPAGIYLLDLTIDRERTTRKIIKQ